MNRRLRLGLAVWMGACWLALVACGGTAPVSGPTDTPEPIVPTRTPQPAMTSAPTAAATATAGLATPVIATPVIATAVIAATSTPTATPTPAPIALAPAEMARFGIAGPVEYMADAAAAGLPMGIALNWQAMADPPVPDGVAFWQMLRLTDEGIRPDLSEVEAILAAQPGAVWLLGNEPDVPWQDGTTAERYAELYHEAYTFIKDRDPSALIGAGGISMPSELRLAYLDDVLEAYQAKTGVDMPVDLWSVHAFTLREELDSWGIGIPPGMDETAGQLFDIEDHADVAIFRQHVRDFRVWMARNGYRETPLAVTEFGILLPTDYGFSDEVVANYLRETIEFMRTASDSEIGYPDDDNRLVQNWFWYSLADDGSYPTGDLYDPLGGTLTPLGNAYRNYLLSLAK